MSLLLLILACLPSGQSAADSGKTGDDGTGVDGTTPTDSGETTPVAITLSGTIQATDSVTVPEGAVHVALFGLSAAMEPGEA